MKRLLISAVILAVLSSCSSSFRRDGGGRICEQDGVTVIELRGDWHQMGRQYGLLAADKMRDVLSYLDGMLSTDSTRTVEAALIADKLYANYPDSLKQFFDGVCETSALSLERVKLCNAVEYVEGVFLCSAMAVWGEYGTGKLVFGRNYDAVSYSEIDRDVVVTVYHPNGGIAAATVGYAGELYCVSGLNANGIFVEFNNGMPSAGAEIHWDRIPSTTSLFSLLFTAESLDDVDAFLKNTRSSLSSVVGVADRNEARAYEWCYDGLRRGDETAQKTLMICTNHYVNPLWPFRTPSDEQSWNSVTRRCNLAARAQECKGDIDADGMKTIMCTPLEDGGPMHSFTRYQIVVIPEDLVMHVHIPCVGKWVELRMGEFLCR